MTLVRWSPLTEFANVQAQMDRILQSVGAPVRYAGGFETPARGGSPVTAVDVIETDEAYVLRAELPGIRLEDVKVHLQHNVLTIKGEKRDVTDPGTDEGSVGFLHTERAFGAFERSFTLGTPIQADSVTARLTDGLLEVRVLKSEDRKLKEIPIETA